MDVQALRADFPILERVVNGKPLVYLDNAATTQKPRSVIQSLVDYYENYNANVHRGVHTLSMEATDMTEAARKRVADFINAPEPETVIWTRNATEGMNIVAHSWGRGNIEPGDEIVTTPMEHHSNLVPWQEIASERGASLRFIPLSDDGTLDLSDLDAIITERTKLLAFTHASNSLGTINPAKLLTEKAHAVGATVLVDGAQSVPHMPVDVEDIGCDFLSFSGHKMMGPTGIGALYAKRELLEGMEPFLTGGEMVLQVSYEKASWADLPWKFEAGTPNIADSIGMGAAVDYLSALGMENVREHEKRITEYALERFKEIEEVDVFGPEDPELRGGVVSFHNEDVHPHDLGTFLDQQGIAVRTGHHCTMPLMSKLGVVATARASFYVYNTEQEIDALVDGIKGALRYFGNGLA
ncbi:MAG: cysteine desulfurase [Chloroflexi bacterium]|nr:cysteine desulfurase [Chloroflexota bacterium]